MLDVLTLVAASVALLYVLIEIGRCMKNKEQKPEKKETFCTCQGMNRKTCNNPQVMQALYNTNTLTEYTDLRKFQDTSVWKNASPYDKFYQYEKKYDSCGRVIA